MGTHNIIVSIYIEKEPHPKLSQLPLGDFLQESQEGVRNSRGKRAISVRATEVVTVIPFQLNWMPLQVLLFVKTAPII